MLVFFQLPCCPALDVYLAMSRKAERIQQVSVRRTGNGDAYPVIGYFQKLRLVAFAQRQKVLIHAAPLFAVNRKRVFAGLLQRLVAFHWRKRVAVGDAVVVAPDGLT